MSKRFKKEKTVGNSDSCTFSNSRFANGYQNQHLPYQSNFEKCGNNVEDRHLYLTPTCLHLPPSCISRVNSPIVNNNNDNNTVNNHESQGIVEKVMFRLVKCFGKKPDNASHDCTNVNCHHGNPTLEERPLISDYDGYGNSDYVYATAATSLSSPCTENATESTSASIDPAEVENWMRRRLYYHFMTPVGKFHAKRRIPFKLFIQILKVLLVTIQLIEFGFYRAAHVSFGELSHKAFCHLYLRQWDSQYETLDYPPATGDYAVYRVNDFYEHVGYAITQFNKTKELSIGGYMFDSMNPTLKLCMKYVSPTTKNMHHMFSVSYIHELEKCISIEVNDISGEQLTDGNSIKTFLQDRGLDIDFNYLLRFDINFNLLSPPIYHLDWIQSTECYRFMIKISLENPSQSGQMKIILHAPYAATPCVDIPKQLRNSNNVSSNTYSSSSSSSSSLLEVPSSLSMTTSLSTPLSLSTQQYLNEKKYRLLVHFWDRLNYSRFNDSSETKYVFSRGLLVVLIDSCTLILGIISLILCIRSIIQGFRMWIETVGFFKNWFGIQLNNVFWEFVRPWIIFIVVNDLIIIITSIYAISTLNRIQMKYEPLTYLMGIGALLVWIGILYYVGFSYDNSLLIRTISRSIPGLLRFCVCALILFFAFSLCGWVVLGPYNMKFRTFMSTVECLFSLINGDDMFVTFTIINENAPIGIYLFSRLFLYIFITLFIYVVLNLFVTIIFEAYEEVKDMQNTRGRSYNSPLWHFVCQQYYDPKSTIFKDDEMRPDRDLLQKQALGCMMTTRSTATTSNTTSRKPSTSNFHPNTLSSIREYLKYKSTKKRQQYQQQQYEQQKCCCCRRQSQEQQNSSQNNARNLFHTSNSPSEVNYLATTSTCISNIVTRNVAEDNCDNYAEQANEQINNDNDVNYFHNRIEGSNEITTADESSILTNRSVIA
ncbi:Mucolipin-2 [Schistosoma japonicum]|uniref:Mucolipin-2 n=1 Tax=Schistosoma japonicum TaxID=6182 RepID=A0A4Z2DEZ4_SCHJA|nr:Mucolipin-2 [Schistosoma japonicum]TNN15037.1 Mucolipin-2 [Schistosoma japonicum]